MPILTLNAVCGSSQQKALCSCSMLSPPRRSAAAAAVVLAAREGGEVLVWMALEQIALVEVGLQ